MPLIEPASGHPQEMELEIISLLIDRTPTIGDYVLQDLTKEKLEFEPVLQNLQLGVY